MSLCGSSRPARGRRRERTWGRRPPGRGALIPAAAGKVCVFKHLSGDGTEKNVGHDGRPADNASRGGRVTGNRALVPRPLDTERIGSPGGKDDDETKLASTGSHYICKYIISLILVETLPFQLGRDVELFTNLVSSLDSSNESLPLHLYSRTPKGPLRYQQSILNSDWPSGGQDLLPLVPSPTLTTSRVRCVVCPDP